MNTEVHKISIVEAILAILFTLLIDALQIVLTFFFVGVFLGIVLDVIYIFIIGTWLFLANHIGKKSAYAFGVALIVEIIPVIQVFPAWTPFILYTIGQSRGWRAAKVFDAARNTVAKTRGGNIGSVTPPRPPQLPTPKPISTPRTPIREIKTTNNSFTPTQQRNSIPKEEPKNLLNLRDRQYNKEQPPNVLDLKKTQ